MRYASEGSSRKLQDANHAKDLTPTHPLPVRLSSNHFSKYSKVVYDANSSNSQNADPSSSLPVSSDSSSSSSHRLRPIPSCPSLAWAIPRPLNKSAPSTNLYKHMKKLQSISLIPDTRDNIFNKIDYSDNAVESNHHFDNVGGLVRQRGGGGGGGFVEKRLDVNDFPPDREVISDDEDANYYLSILRYLFSLTLSWMKLFLANTLLSGRLLPTIWFLVVFLILSIYLYKWFLSSNSGQPKRRRGPRFRRLQRWVGKLPGV